MQNFTKYLFLSCLKASELIEKKLHFKLTFSEKLQLTVHKSMCDACRLYEKQSTLIEKGISMQKPKKSMHIDLEELKKSIHHSLEINNGD